MCLPFCHKYKIVGGWHGYNLMGGYGTMLEKVCKICGKFAQQMIPGDINIDNLIDKQKHKLSKESEG